MRLHSRVTFDDVDIEGITKITAKYIEFADTFGKVIKLLGITKLTEDGIEASVHPVLLDKKHPLAAVRDSFNAVFVHGDAVDDAMFYGRGAGALPTASAVFGDIIEICRNIVSGCTGRISSTCEKSIKIKKPEEISGKYFIRLKVKDTRGVFASIAGVLANNEISLLQVEQLKSVDGIAEIVVVTEEVERKHINDAMVLFKGMSNVEEICSIIQVY